MQEGTSPEDVIRFWREAGPARWFTRDEAFDAQCRERFFRPYEAASRGELSGWEKTADGALALVLLLDQMPRNMFRGEPRTWATDPLALAAAERAITNGFDRAVGDDLRQFLYLPFMHAEDLPAQERSVELYRSFGSEENRKFAKHHRDIIARFGRFPHRNEVLERPSTPEELAFLEEDDFRG